MPINNQNIFLHSPAAIFFRVKNQAIRHNSTKAKTVGCMEQVETSKSTFYPAIDQLKSVGIAGDRGERFLASVLRCGCLNSGVLPVVLAGFHSVCQPNPVSLASIACREESVHSQTHLYVHKHLRFQVIQAL